MQRYKILFITVNALHISGGFSAHHQEFKNSTHSIGYMSSLLAAIASVGELEHFIHTHTHTHTYTGYVIIIAFPQQRATMLRYTRRYIECLVLIMRRIWNFTATS